MSDITKQKNTKFFKFLPYLNISFVKANFLIFALIFANIGGIKVVTSQAATTNYVNFVYFCAKGSACDTNSTVTLANTALTVRKYYGTKLGKSFTIGYVYHIVGNQPAGWYGNYSKNTVATWRNITTELFARGQLNGANKTIVQLAFPSMSNCGIAEVNGIVGVVDGSANSYCLPNWHAVVAHELGHTLGFPHYDDGRLMDSVACRSTAGQSIYNCPINDSHAAFMKYSPWINNLAYK